MLKLAFEAPIWNTGLALEMGDYAFVIASKLLSSPEYARAIKACKKPKYLDNGAYEGELLTTDELLSLAETYKPEVVVAPDIIGDAEQTIELTKGFVEKLTSKHTFKVMFVPQGDDNVEKIACYHEIADFLAFHEREAIVGLGLGAFKKDWRERYKFYATYSGEIEVVRIHILGAANLVDILLWNDVADTLDTSLPFHLAQEGQNLVFNVKRTKRINWNVPLKNEGLTTATFNLGVIRRALENA